MIFKHTIGMVLGGAKTNTRRVKKNREYLGQDKRGNKCVFTANGRVKWRVGGTVSVQPGYGKKAVGRIILTDVREEIANEISEADALAEGFQSRADFLALWHEMHKRDDQTVWALTFKLFGE